MAEAERAIGHTCIKGFYLDELDPKSGKGQQDSNAKLRKLLRVELADIPVKNIDDVMSGKITIYQAA